MKTKPRLCIGGPAILTQPYTLHREFTAGLCHGEWINCPRNASVVVLDISKCKSQALVKYNCERRINHPPCDAYGWIDVEYLDELGAMPLFD